MIRPFFPDKPTDSGPGVLPSLVDGEWLCQMKHDGWRCVIEWGTDDQSLRGGNVWLSDEFTSFKLTSRHRERIPASADLARALGRVLERVKAPPGTVLDSEWMGRRDSQPESLVLFDLLAWGGEWLGEMPAKLRYGRLRELFGRCGAPGEWIGRRPVGVVDCWLTGYAAMFEDAKRTPGVEGIVLKRVDSRYIGSTRRCVDNPAWLKVKWRAGESGSTLIA